MALDTLRAAVWPPSDVPLDRATVTGSTLLKNNALIASLLVIGKTSFRSSIIQDAGSCAQRLSKKFIPVHAAAVVPGPLERPAAHPHSA